MNTLTKLPTMLDKVQKSQEIMEKISNSVFGEDLISLLSELEIDEYLKTGDAWLCGNSATGEFVMVTFENNTFNFYNDDNELIDSYSI